MILVLRCVVVVCALLVLGKGVSLLRSPGRRRVGSVLVTMGVLFSAVGGLFVFEGVRGSPLASAPGRGARVGGSVPLLHEETPGILGAASYERDFYGAADSASSVAKSLYAQLAPFGYRQSAPTAGPGFRPGEPSPSAQFELGQWRYRVYEVAMPTRFAGRYFDGRAFAHLVAVVLSNDGR